MGKVDIKAAPHARDFGAAAARALETKGPPRRPRRTNMGEAKKGKRPPRPPNYPVCGAKKRDGTPCQKLPVAGRRRCRVHGGATPVGPAHHRFKHGLYSRLLPKNLRDAFDQRLRATAELSFRDDIDQCRRELGETLDSLRGRDLLKLWPKLCTQWEAYAAACEEQDQEARGTAARAVTEILRQGMEEEQVWRRAVRLALRVGKLCAHEWRRMRGMGYVTGADEAMTLVMALATAARRQIHDLQTLTLIAGDL